MWRLAIGGPNLEQTLPNLEVQTIIQSRVYKKQSVTFPLLESRARVPWISLPCAVDESGEVLAQVAQGGGGVTIREGVQEKGTRGTE